MVEAGVAFVFYRQVEPAAVKASTIFHLSTRLDSPLSLSFGDLMLIKIFTGIDSIKLDL